MTCIGANRHSHSYSRERYSNSSTRAPHSSHYSNYRRTEQPASPTDLLFFWGGTTPRRSAKTLRSRFRSPPLGQAPFSALRLSDCATRTFGRCYVEDGRKQRREPTYAGVEEGAESEYEYTSPAYVPGFEEPPNRTARKPVFSTLQ